MQTLRFRTAAARGLARSVSLLAIAGLVVVSGCRKEEQDRPIAYEKGAQLQTAPLNDAAAESLRHRAAKQGFSL